MLSSERFEAYRSALDEVSSGAADYLKAIFEEARKMHPDLTVAKWREFAIAAMQAAAETYGDMGAELACRLYDSQVAASGYNAATMPAALDRQRAEKVARYQAGKLVEGDFEGFERECAAFVSNHVREFANSTMTYNWARSARQSSRYRSASVKAGHGGVRFARVPRGGETCTFCIMLASRGFVYWSRETAGEFNHYHRNCRCLVVPDDGSGEVEGYDSGEWYERWKAYEEIDASGDFSSIEKKSAKGIVYGNPAVAPVDALDSVRTLFGGDSRVLMRLGGVLSKETVPLPSGRDVPSSKSSEFDVVTLPNGRRFLFKAGMNSQAQSLSAAQLLSAYEALPVKITDRMQTEIYIVDYQNPCDAYWRKHYKGFTRSYATGGDAITFWAYPMHDDEYLRGTLCHETGHYIDKQMATNKAYYSDESEWQDAITLDYRNCGQAHPSKYAANSNGEDFAESVKGYALDKDSFAKRFPTRTGILDRIFGVI